MRLLQSVLLKKNQSSYRGISSRSSKTFTGMTPSIEVASNNATRRFHDGPIPMQPRHQQHMEMNHTTYTGRYNHNAPRISMNRWKSTTADTVASAAATTIRPWPDHMIESRGDYRDEMWLEEYIGGPLYQYQKSLPTLPVISNVETTLQRLVPTILPLAKNDIEVSHVQSCVSKFPKQANHLQERLQQHAKTIGTSSSWLQQWWNTYCYLQVRDSVVINVSYFFHFQSDPTITNIVQRAAAIAYMTGQFRNGIVSGQYPAEQIGKGSSRKPLCSVAYKYMLHACRVPQANQDTYRIYDPSKYHHVIVSIRGQFYKVPLFNPNTNEPYSMPEIENAIQQCIDYANDVNDRHLLQLGWCTSSNRDKWASVRQQLLNVGGIEMEQALRDIESGVVAICLDIDDAPVSRTEIAQMLLHGTTSSTATTTTTNTSNSSGTGGNRWFDKSIQFVLANHGRAAGLLGEHSMMDGMPVVQLANYVTQKSYAECCQECLTRTNSSSPATAITVQPIFSEELCNKIRSVAEPSIEVGKRQPNISILYSLCPNSLFLTLMFLLVEIYEIAAKNDFNDLVGNNSLHVQSFQGYGSTFMKQSGYSPDAYVQMAMQIATYRLWGEQVGTYEATQVRPFLHGRTETTRSVSLESAALVQKFGLHPANDESNVPERKEKLQLFKSAVKAHVKYIQDASQANGVDRHLLGLSMLVKDGEALPDLYNDPVFQRGKRWRVSTSHLTHPKFDGWGYGQVVPDGVGLAYSIHPRHCIFNITALKSTGWTDKLSQLLEESLLELRTMIEVDAIESSKHIASKL